MPFAAYHSWSAGAAPQLARWSGALASGLARFSGKHFPKEESCRSPTTVGVARLREDLPQAGVRLLSWAGSPLGGTRFIAVGDVRLDEREGLRAQLNLPAGTVVSDLDLALRYVIARGPSAVDDLRGDFAFVVFAQDGAQILAARDPFGVKPLFFVRQASGIAFSTLIEPLLAGPDVKLALDLRRVCEYLGAGCIGYGHTFFRDVTAFEPGTTVVLNGLAWDVDRYFRRPRPAGPCRDRREHFDEVARVFKRAVGRRVSDVERVAVRVSGGLDSSTIAGALDDLQGRPQVQGVAAIFPGWPCDESRYIDAVARKVRFPIVRFDGRRPTTRDLDDPLPAWPEGRECLAGGSEELDIAQAFGAQVLLCGMRGDAVMQDLAALDELLARGMWLPAAKMVLLAPLANKRRRMKRFVRGAVARVIGLPPLLPVLGPHYPAPSWATDELRRCWPGPPSPREFLDEETGPVGFLQAQIWESLSARYTTLQLDASVRYALDAGIDLRLPLLDRDLVETILKIPTEERLPWRGSRALQREGLATLLPSLVRNRRRKAEFSRARIARFGWAKDVMQRMFQSRWETGWLVDAPRLRSHAEHIWSLPESERPLRDCHQIYSAACFEAWFRTVLRYHTQSQG